MSDIFTVVKDSSNNIIIECKTYLPTKDFKSFKRMNFKVDTGACITLIPKKFLWELGYTEEDFKTEYFQKDVMIVAGGMKTEIFTITLPQLSIGENIFHNVRVIIANEGNLLLGTDLLQAFDFSISFVDKKVNYTFRGIDGKGSIIKPITGKVDDFCAYEVTNSSTNDLSSQGILEPIKSYSFTL